jgi:polyisoprenoid-binding protein YceI
MKTILLVTIAALGLVSFRDNDRTSRMFVVSKATVLFRSEARLELINASSNGLKGVINTSSRTFTFSIDMNSFEGFNNYLQKEHFRKNYIESERFPLATFSGKIIESDDFRNDGCYVLRAKGKLSLHGIENERIIRADITVKNGVLRLNSCFTVMLADHEITVPVIVNEKLATAIKVKIDADFILQ